MRALLPHGIRRTFRGPHRSGRKGAADHTRLRPNISKKPDRTRAFDQSSQQAASPQRILHRETTDEPPRLVRISGRTPAGQPARTRNAAGKTNGDFQRTQALSGCAVDYQAYRSILWSIPFAGVSCQADRPRGPAPSNGSKDVMLCPMSYSVPVRGRLLLTLSARKPICIP